MSRFVLCRGDKESDAACLPGCGLYLGEELSSTLLSIMYLTLAEYLLCTQASTRHCEVDIGPIFQRKKLSFSLWAGCSLLAQSYRIGECWGKASHLCFWGSCRELFSLTVRRR